MTCPVPTKNSVHKLCPQTLSTAENFGFLPNGEKREHPVRVRLDVAMHSLKLGRMEIFLVGTTGRLKGTSEIEIIDDANCESARMVERARQRTGMTFGSLVPQLVESCACAKAADYPSLRVPTVPPASSAAASGSD